MKRALFITWNEVKLYVQDKGDMAFSLLLPVITFALMFGAFGGQTLFKATASIVDEDRGVYSQQLIKQLDAIDGISVDVISAEEADTKLNRSDLLMVLFIPSGFSDALESGGKAELIFKQRGNGGQEGQIIASMIRGIAANIDQVFQIRSAVKTNLEGSNTAENRINVTVQDLLVGQQKAPAVGVNEELTGGSANFVDQFLPGIITMYAMFSLTLVAITIVQERRRGTLERLLTTRLSVGQLFFGKFLSIVGRGVVQTFILLVLSYAVFQIFTPLSFLMALVITIIFCAAVAGLGMIIASVSRTEDAANWIAVVITMFMAMMGGTFFELTQGSVLAKIGAFSLNTYANRALKTIITEGGSLADAWQALAIMAGVAVVGLIISRLIFKAVPGSK
jgi:linearmycin/streptolysin S transport system permease protein